jgi:hypothetical protein
VDALTNPSVQHALSIVLAALASAGVLLFVAMASTARRAASTGARLLRRRVAVVSLFVALAAGAAFGVLSLPVDSGSLAQPTDAPRSGSPSEPDVVSAERFSSGKLPALSLTAPDGWRLELDGRAHKLIARGNGARLQISTAILTETVDVESLLRQLADGQRALGFDVGETFTDRLGDLPATGFLATAPSRSVCAWLIRRDAHLASSVICSSEGKASAREACRAPLASLRWRPLARTDH